MENSLLTLVLTLYILIFFFLIILPILIGNEDETNTLNLRVLASEEIDKIQKYLKFDSPK